MKNEKKNVYFESNVLAFNSRSPEMFQTFYKYKCRLLASLTIYPLEETF